MGKTKKVFGSTESLTFANTDSPNGSEEDEESPGPEAIKKKAQSKAAVQIRGKKQKRMKHPKIKIKSGKPRARNTRLQSLHTFAGGIAEESDAEIIIYALCPNKKIPTDRSNAYGTFAKAFFDSSLGSEITTIMNKLYSIFKYSEIENDLSEEIPSVDDLYRDLKKTKDKDAEAFSKNKDLFNKVLQGVHGAIVQATTLKNKRPTKTKKKIMPGKEQKTEHADEAAVMENESIETDNSSISSMNEMSNGTPRKKSKKHDTGGPSKCVPSNPKEKLKAKKEQKQSLQSQDKKKVVPSGSRFQSSSQQNIPNRKENDIEQSIPKPIKMVVKDSGARNGSSQSQIVQNRGNDGHDDGMQPTNHTKISATGSGIQMGSSQTDKKILNREGKNTQPVPKSVKTVAKDSGSQNCSIQSNLNNRNDVQDSEMQPTNQQSKILSPGNRSRKRPAKSSQQLDEKSPVKTNVETGFAGTRKHFTKVSNEEDDDTRHDEQKDRVESLTPDRETVLTSDSESPKRSVKLPTPSNVMDKKNGEKKAKMNHAGISVNVGPPSSSGEKKNCDKNDKIRQGAISISVRPPWTSDDDSDDAIFPKPKPVPLKKFKLSQN